MNKRRILVIDDEPSIARLISAALSQAKVDHILDHCTDGAQGRIRASQGRYDLVALDLAMPFMDGVTALAEMKEDPRSAQIPVIVVTGRHDPALHQQVLELGAAAVIVKPFQAQEIATVFVRILAGEPGGGMGEEVRPLGT